MYDTMQWKFLLPHMANDVYKVASSFETCARNFERLNRKRHFTLFHAAGPLEFIAVNILGPLARTKNGNALFIVMTDRYSNLTREISISRTRATHKAKEFFDRSIVPYGILHYLITNNSRQFVSTFFATRCGILGLKHLRSTAYHLQTNELVERYNKTIVASLRQFVGEHQDNWDILAPR